MTVFPFKGELRLQRSLERELVCKVAGCELTRAVFFPCGYLMLAYLLSIWTARMKGTAGRWVGRTRDFAFKNDRLHYLVRVQCRDGGHERLGIRMQRLIKQVGCGRDLHQPPQVH